MFRRRQPSAPADPIGAFWAWWADEGATAVARAIEDGAVTRVEAELSARVHAMNPCLAWEVGPATASAYSLVVSAECDSELRVVAERWLRAAPAADPTWAFHAARQPSPSAGDAILTLDGAQLAVSEFAWTLEIDDHRARIDVVAHHPQFAAMADEPRAHAAFLALDWLFGEDDVERWIGAVQTSAAVDATSQPSAALAEVIARLAASPTQQWALLKGTDGHGHELVATARRPLKWIEHLPMDQHIAVTQHYTPGDDRGLPSAPAMDALQAAEQELERQLGDAAVAVASVTTQGRRTLHLYADSTDPAAVQAVRRWAAGRKRTFVADDHDPGWRAVRRFS